MATDRSRAVLGAAALALVVLLGVAVLTRVLDGDGEDGGGEPAARPGVSEATSSTDRGAASPPGARRVLRLPSGGQHHFTKNRFLVAYYGTAGTDALGVLGEGTPARVHPRLLRAARDFAGPDRPVQPVYELIVTVADATPGRDGDYSHDIARASVQRYIDAAHRHGALLLLDIQPGRSDFLTVAKRWKWALQDPYVGLALDPEWRMGPREVPGRTIGSVDATEVNEVSSWLSGVVERQQLPEKLLVVHQFRTDMLTRPRLVKQREGLALVQHVDGFGTPGQKRATYGTVARPGTFTMGFKLFYDEDRPRMSARDVLALDPQVRFVSFQ
ncbi:hypothetical protein [Nocardioides nanhaiensis]|uniref:Lipoprotein n=1 Tax=Nocardioides nanhaiensis TaxID=1476871 RepID=A0ABP8W4Y5_9ACTN